MAGLRSSQVLYKAHPDELGLAVAPTNAKGADPLWMTLALQTTVVTIPNSSRGLFDDTSYSLSTVLNARHKH